LRWWGRGRKDAGDAVGVVVVDAIAMGAADAVGMVVAGVVGWCVSEEGLARRTVMVSLSWHGDRDG
jgi:hypothetical protein